MAALKRQFILFYRMLIKINLIRTCFFILILEVLIIIEENFSLFSKKYKKHFHQKYIINFARKNDFIKLIGKENFHQGSNKDFFSLCHRLPIDILHFNRGNSEDFYTKEINHIPSSIKVCETNIFGKESNNIYMNKLSSVFFVSKWLMKKAEWSSKYSSKILYNPICEPKLTTDLRTIYNISHDAIVLGRISRPNLDDGKFILKALEEVLNKDTFFLIIGATDKFKDQSKNNTQIICIEPTTDEKMLSRFYNTIDILLHYRKEGETFGMNIAEAMIHGKPVISHYSHEDNAQAELLLEEKTCGIVVEENNLEQYIDAILSLIKNSELRFQYGKNAKYKSTQMYSEENVTKLLEKFYDEIN